MSRLPTERFTDRVENYARHRPGYPPELLAAIQEETGLGPGQTVADVGSGTGIFSAALLGLGCRVIGVEPNAAMRAVAEAALPGEDFTSSGGTAEVTGLPDMCADAWCAAQAFHWFDPARARAEARRILRPPGPALLVWNTRKLDATPFLRDYEALLCRFGTDYLEVGHRQVDEARLRQFYGSTWSRHIFDHVQHLDWDGLRGRLLSSSYVPGPEHPGHAHMLHALQHLFAKHQQDDEVEMQYEAELYCGSLR